MADPTTQPKRKGSLTSASVYFFEQLMPDPFVLAIAITAFVAVGAALFAPHGSIPTILTSWYGGIFNILAFAFQMILILVAGNALAHAPLIQRGLQRLVSFVKTPNQAVILTFLVAAVASWVNWGFGLVIGAVLAREVARRIRLDFAWLVAAAYSGWVIWGSGLSGSIAISQATPGNALNIVEKVTGKILPFSESIFAPFNLIPTALVMIIVPVIFILAKPREEEAQIFVPPEPVTPAATKTQGPVPIARKMDRSRAGSLFLVLLGLGYIAVAVGKGEFRFDANAVIFCFIMAGLALYSGPVTYLKAIKDAAAQSGAMMLQYPFYGGIMGIMVGTGMAQEISKAISSVATSGTLPFLSFIGSLFITILIPSGGGHWAVQGPLTVPAAVDLHASVAATTMAVSMGEQVSNMLQPFWALTVVSIAGIGVQRVLAFTMLTFLAGVVIYGAALLLLI